LASSGESDTPGCVGTPKTAAAAEGVLIVVDGKPLSGVVVDVEGARAGSDSTRKAGGCLRPVVAPITIAMSATASTVLAAITARP
jgi:hypothetical protein